MLLPGSLLLAQSSSAYTRYGIGDLDYSYSSRTLAMGGSGVSLNDAGYISDLNPAGINGLKRTRLELAVKYNGMFLSNSRKSTYYGKADFGGFAFGFPVSEEYGVGAVLGIVPYSTVSYNVSESVTSQNTIGGVSTNHTVSYEGTGGLSKLFVGTSYKLPFGLSIGASLDYYFGNINYISSVNFSDLTNGSAEYTRKYQPKGMGTTIGIISPDLSSAVGGSISDLKIGLSAVIIPELNTDTLLISKSNTRTDTIAHHSVGMQIPVRVAGGLSFLLKEKYLFNIDVNYQPWSQFKFNENTSPYLRDAFRVSAGFEYQPKNEMGSSFWEQIKLRAGLSFEETQYKINNQGINKIAVSGGFSLPVSAQNTIDVSLQYAIRGTTNSNLLKENVFTAGFGISLGDIWFIRHSK